MYKFISGLCLLLAFSSTSLGDVVDPISNDEWKTLEVKVKQLDQRTLPNSGNETYLMVWFGDESRKIPTQSTSQGNDHSFEITIPTRENGSYSVTYYGPFGQLSMLAGRLDKGTKSIEARLKRIDVNDMVITRQNGTKYISKGTASIYSPTSDGYSSYSMSLLTGLGIDVPVGRKYNARVQAPSEDGNDLYQSATLDFTQLK